MIDRFNFYDIYGYAIPGIVLFALLWLPYGLAVGALPDADLASAVAGLVLAYVTGHMLQLVSRTAFPSKVRKPGTDELRFPNDFVLDDDDRALSPSIKQQVIACIMERFQLDVSDKAFSQVGDPQKSREIVRNDAFMLCRAALVSGETASYAEQFQGMYALMRGLLAAMVLGAFFQAGWAIKSSAFQIHHSLGVLEQVAAGLFLAALAIAVFVVAMRARKALKPDRQRYGRWWFFGAMGFSLALGALALFGVADQGELRTTILLFFSAAALLCLGYLCNRSHQFFAQHFAVSVYRHLLVQEIGETSAGATSGMQRCSRPTLKKPTRNVRNPRTVR